MITLNGGGNCNAWTSLLSSVSRENSIRSRINAVVLPSDDPFAHVVLSKRRYPSNTLLLSNGKQQQCLSPPLNPVPTIYVCGAYEALGNYKMLSNELGVRRILAIGEFAPSVHDEARYPPYNMDVLVISCMDHPSANIHTVFNQAICFIDGMADIDPNGAVLVHCQVGMSRSVTLVLAYMLARGLAATPRDALEMVRKRRSIANPNPGFMNQLSVWWRDAQK